MVDGSFSQNDLAESVQKQLDKGWSVERTFSHERTVWVVFNTQTYIEIEQEHIYQ